MAREALCGNAQPVQTRAATNFLNTVDPRHLRQEGCEWIPPRHAIARLNECVKPSAVMNLIASRDALTEHLQSDLA